MSWSSINRNAANDDPDDPLSVQVGMIRFATDSPHHLVEKHSHTLRFEMCGACVHSRTSVCVPIYWPKEIFQIVSFTFPSSHINTYQRESCTRWNCRVLPSGQILFDLLYHFFYRVIGYWGYKDGVFFA
uniref:Uncharacterized protein n=1 Tax=Bionectria ochroleuca TaxID=29856 RepID=A0A0B7JW67_BIOOC